jgi:hypothetical protein
MAPKPGSPRSGRRMRFGIKTLFAIVTILCVLLAMIARPLVEAHRHRGLIAQVTSLGGKVSHLGWVSRPFSPSRALLAMVDVSYANYPVYGLDFSGTKLNDDDLALINQVEHIRELILRNTQISDEGLPYLQKVRLLRSLDLRGTTVTDRGLAHLQDMNDLVSVRLAQTKVTYAALEALDARLPYTESCEERAIDELQLPGIQMVAFPGTVQVARSHEPSRSFNTVGRARFIAVGMQQQPLSISAEHVTHLAHLSSLKEMRINSVTFDSQCLSGLGPLPKLEQIDIYFTNLTDTDLKSIARQTQLRTLTIYKANELTDAGVAQLESLTNLQNLRIASCEGVTKAGMEALAIRLPNCKCEFDVD